MALTPAQIATLKTELTTDPHTLGYAPFVAQGATVSLAGILNLPRAGEATQFRNSVSASEVVACLVFSEYTALTAAAQNCFNVVVAGAPLDATNATLRTLMAAIFASGTTTRTNLINVASRQGSRAEALFGVNVSVTSDDVAAALK